MIEVADYETYVLLVLMDSKMNQMVFWQNVAKYSQTKTQDQNFVNEIAYVMVTLHRTGA